ncbi:MAG: hypothetical protein K2I06_05275 [Ruminococcus sp.]|nr:hypothetical protein [Ruminococcus sp.]
MERWIGSTVRTASGFTVNCVCSALRTGESSWQRAYNKRSNNIPKVCLNFKTPNEVLNYHLMVM